MRVLCRVCFAPWEAIQGSTDQDGGKRDHHERGNCDRYGGTDRDPKAKNDREDAQS